MNNVDNESKGSMTETAGNPRREPWEALDDDLDETSVGVASAEECERIDDAAGLQMISIRLQKALLRNLKEIAEYHKVGYQPLIRDLLNRFAQAEMKLILNKLVDEKQAQLRQIESDTKTQPTMKAVDEFLARERKQA